MGGQAGWAAGLCTVTKANVTHRRSLVVHPPYLLNILLVLIEMKLCVGQHSIVLFPWPIRSLKQAMEEKETWAYHKASVVSSPSFLLRQDRSCVGARLPCQTFLAVIQRCLLLPSKNTIISVLSNENTNISVLWNENTNISILSNEKGAIIRGDRTIAAMVTPLFCLFINYSYYVRTTHYNFILLNYNYS